MFDAAADAANYGDVGLTVKKMCWVSTVDWQAWAAAVLLSSQFLISSL